MTKELYLHWQNFFKDHPRVAFSVELLATRLAGIAMLIPVLVVWFPAGRLYIVWAGINLFVGWLLLVQGIAHMFPSKRPYQIFDFVPVRGRGLFSRVDAKADAFPSGHTTALCILALSLAPFNFSWSMIGFLVAVSAGAGRVLLGWHFTRDIVAGVLLAVGVVLGTYYCGMFDFLLKIVV